MSGDNAAAGKKPWYKRWWVWAIAVVVVISAASGSSGSSDSGSSVSDSSSNETTQVADKSSPSASESESDSKKSKDDGCGTKATDDCTPHVGPNGGVRVDALNWRLTSARTASTIGDQQYGLGAKASGRFVIAKLTVRSDKDESATLSDDVIKLEVNGNTYDADNDGTVAAIGNGQEPFFLDTVGPDSTKSGTVVFDLPKKVLGKKLELRFNELGFGETHAYIRLPKL
jgi:hypothetical protein